MLRTKYNYQFDKFDYEKKDLYVIAPNDRINVKVLPNDGERLLEVNLSNMQLNAGGSYAVEYDGTVKMPIFGRVKVSGMTIRALENFLEEKYSLYFNKPFVTVDVSNSRVIIFPGGSGGSARVLGLQNENTTLFEVIAQAGGISDGKAYKIKLIRGDLKSPKIYLIDLSKIETMKQADLILQANDIIYVEPTFRAPSQIVGFVTPYLTLLSTITLIVTLIKK
ncbi:MAG: hypothetical protein A2X12_07295 [Bacteroidetes bacterium GWE2_29_8]|nr:MAG: hypothetical protein A2X12_07295 [Bacteroidetes bacterium GWE2_29_8]OFY22582.1 MAG: hypothetical protein A2X02_02340 [Bacteroidetes bacterium GWF2_29_10]